MEEQRKDDYNKKLMDSQARKKQRDMQEELERKEQQKLNQLNQRKRKMILEERRREEEMRVHELMARQESGNEALAQVMEQQRRMHLLKRERINLSQEQKRLNVERQKRIAEYKRLQTLRKIKADEEKVARMQREKERMLQNVRQPQFK